MASFSFSGAGFTGVVLPVLFASGMGILQEFAQKYRLYEKEKRWEHGRIPSAWRESR
jgi:hypothetical protein